MPTHLPWYHEYLYRNTIHLYRFTFYVEGSLYIHLTIPTFFMLLRFTYIYIFQQWRNKDIYYHAPWTHCGRLTEPSHFLNKCWFNVSLAYFDIRICVGVFSGCCRFTIGFCSGLFICCRLRFQHCAYDRSSVGVMLVVYRSQIGRFHTEFYPQWPRHEQYWFYGVFSNIVGGRQLTDSMKILRFCRFRVGLASVTGV